MPVLGNFLPVFGLISVFDVKMSLDGIFHYECLFIFRLSLFHSHGTIVLSNFAHIFDTFFIFNV